MNRLKFRYHHKRGENYKPNITVGKTIYVPSFGCEISGANMICGTYKNPVQIDSRKRKNDDRVFNYVRRKASKSKVVRSVRQSSGRGYG